MDLTSIYVSKKEHVTIPVTSESNGRIGRLDRHSGGDPAMERKRENNSNIT